MHSMQAKIPGMSDGYKHKLYKNGQTSKADYQQAAQRCCRMTRNSHARAARHVSYTVLYAPVQQHCKALHAVVHHCMLLNKTVTVQVLLE